MKTFLLANDCSEDDCYCEDEEDEECDEGCECEDDEDEDDCDDDCE